ncbi:MAG: DUF4133 domain-containing protein [Bacteroidetes bacterium]|nr:DUF4133 domain-containing protein [Bacteroidota bacterium]
MSRKTYIINRRIGKSLEVKGIKGQYIVYLVAGLVGALLLFVVLYLAGVPQYSCIALVLLAATIHYNRMRSLSKRYGEYGLMKRKAARKLPPAIISRTRKAFILKS